MVDDPAQRFLFGTGSPRQHSNSDATATCLALCRRGIIFRSGAVCNFIPGCRRCTKESTVAEKV